MCCCSRCHICCRLLLSSAAAANVAEAVSQLSCRGHLQQLHTHCRPVTCSYTVCLHVIQQLHTVCYACTLNHRPTQLHVSPLSSPLLHTGSCVSTCFPATVLPLLQLHVCPPSSPPLHTGSTCSPVCLCRCCSSSRHTSC
jgi:hypothetical protein